MATVNLECDQISDFFEKTTVLAVRDKMMRFRSEHTADNHLYGVDQYHLGYLWFYKTILSHINQHFGVDAKLSYAMLLDCLKPFDIHHDIKPLPDALGRHWRSFLIPISVNHDLALVHNASTLIFDQDFITAGDLGATPSIPNNVRCIYQEKISHVSPDKIDKLSLRRELIWNTGDLLWWDSPLYHVSNNFPAKGFNSKQAIVLHTYVL